MSFPALKKSLKRTPLYLLYRRIKTVKYFFRFGHKFGYTETAKLIFKLLKGGGPDEIYLPEISRPIHVRISTSDFPTLNKIFIDEEYKLPVNIEPKLIVDGGANIGCASVFFANRYPGAQIIAIEPEESNFSLLEVNTRHYTNIRLIKAALWNKNGNLKIIEFEEYKKWGFRVEETQSFNSDTIKAITLTDVLKKPQYDRIDILKLDIEGAEKEVFTNNYEEWLPKVGVIIIELHDRFKPGCSEAFYSATGKYGFDEFRKGENIILISSSLKTREY